MLIGSHQPSMNLRLLLSRPNFLFIGSSFLCYRGTQISIKKKDLGTKASNFFVMGSHGAHRFRNPEGDRLDPYNPSRSISRIHIRRLDAIPPMGLFKPSNKSVAAGTEARISLGTSGGTKVLTG